MRKVVFVVSFFFMLNFVDFIPKVYAQSETETNVEMADKMRSDGKIYVVVAVVAIVISGLLIYAINTDRKVLRLEKEIKDLKSSRDS